MNRLARLALSAILTVSPVAALSDPPSRSDQGPISTAPAAEAPAGVRREGATDPKPPISLRGPLSTNEQIEAFIRSSPPEPWRNDAPLAADDIDPKRDVHGQMGVAIGSGGYRSAFVQSDIPIGRTGLLSVVVQETRSDRTYGYHGGYGDRRSLGLSLYLGGAGPLKPCRGRDGALRDRSGVGHDGRGDECSSAIPRSVRYR